MRTISALCIFAIVITACSSNQAKSENQASVSPSPTISNSQIESAKQKKYNITDTKIPTLKPSDLIEKLRKKMEETPGISGKQLADFGNQILKTEGYDYTFDWEPKGKENEENLAKLNFENFYPFKYEFTDTSGKKQLFQLMNDDFGHPCSSVIDIPVSKVSEQLMTVVSDGKEIDLKRPQEFGLEDVELLDKDLKKAIRKWKSPIDATPVGISEDGTKIYFESWEFYQDENDGGKEKPIKLAVEVSADGSLKLIDENEIKSDRGVVFDYDKKFTEIQYSRFKVGSNEYILKYTAPCT